MLLSGTVFGNGGGFAERLPDGERGCGPSAGEFKSSGGCAGAPLPPVVALPPRVYSPPAPAAVREVPAPAYSSAIPAGWVPPVRRATGRGSSFTTATAPTARLPSSTNGTGPADLTSWATTSSSATAPTAAMARSKSAHAGPSENRALMTTPWTTATTSTASASAWSAISTKPVRRRDRCGRW